MTRNSSCNQNCQNYNEIKDFFLNATLNELSEATGVASSRWSRYFNKTKQVSEPTLERVAKSFNISLLQALELIINRRETYIDNRHKKR